MFVDDDDFDERREPGGRRKTVGVLERRANVTVIGGEVVIGKEARGEIKVCMYLGFIVLSCSHAAQFNMLVSYTYRSEDNEAADETTTPSQSQSRAPSTKSQPVMKTFSFYTVLDLGLIVPREEPRSDAMDV